MNKDKVYIGYSSICLTDNHPIEFLYYILETNTWYLDEDKLRKHCCEMANTGINFWRLLPYGIWGPRPYGIKSQFQPYEIVDNRFDLSRFNNYYFPIMRKIIQIINNPSLNLENPGQGVMSLFCFVDNCQHHIPLYRKFSPFCNNIQDPTGIWGNGAAFAPGADPYTRAFIYKSFEQFKDLNIGWSWGNEITGWDCYYWAKRVVWPFLVDKIKELDFSVMSYGATMESRFYTGIPPKFYDMLRNMKGEPRQEYDVLDMFKGEFDIYLMQQLGMSEREAEHIKLLLIREGHGCNAMDINDPNRIFGHQLHQMMTFWGNNPIVCMISDDGTLDADSLCDRVGTQVRPSAERWYNMVKYVLDNYKISGNYNGYDYPITKWFEHLPKGYDSDCQINTMNAIARAYHDKFGVWPYNYGKYPYIPIVNVKIKASDENGKELTVQGDLRIDGVIQNVNIPYEFKVECGKNCYIHGGAITDDGRWITTSVNFTSSEGLIIELNFILHDYIQVCNRKNWLKPSLNGGKINFKRWFMSLFGGEKKCVWVKKIKKEYFNF